MDWKTLLVYITGTVDQELLLRNELTGCQEFPLLTCESQATMVADNLVRVSNSHCCL